MDEVRVSKETYDKMVNVLAQLPYGQIASLLSEVVQNTHEIKKDVTADGD